jgi:hypothetical protein
MALDEDLVRTTWRIVPPEKVIETNLIERSGRCICGDVAANRNPGSLRSVHHNRCIPSHPSSVGSLKLLVARKVGFIFRGDGIDVVSCGDQGNVELKFV